MKKVMALLIVLSVVAGVIPAVAAAQNYNIKEMTPAIKQALDSRRARFDTLEEKKQAGAIGEDNHGYVAVLKEGAQATTLAAEENKDRHVIYVAIAEQNNLSQAMGTIESVFADVQRNKAQPGQYIQQNNGEWVRK